MTEYNTFCYAKHYNDEDSFQQKRYRIFNKQFTRKEYYKIKEEIDLIMKDVKLELNKNSWRDEWKKVPNETWKKLSKVEGFDKEVVESIIGFELDL